MSVNVSLMNDRAAESEVTELRWFAPGRGPVLAQAKHRHRVDRYHLASLSPETAVKARGRRARVEAKMLVGRAAPVEVAGGLWSPERWLKATEFDLPYLGDTAAWLAVEKWIWRSDDVEVCRINLAGVRWWSLAVKVRNGHAASPQPALVEHLLASHRSIRCCSYPSWLLSQVRDRPPARQLVTLP
jgi:hypothetical protein